MFTTGFITEPAPIAETMDGITVDWMKQTAIQLKCSLAGSLIIKEGKEYYNRLVYSDRAGNISWYDKRHLFRMAGEEAHFTRGMKPLIVTLKEWRISFQICYDLRFPVWSRNRENYEVLVNLANWPSSRDDVWRTLLKARAIENQSYVLGVNRTGMDGNNIAYAGNSLVIDPKGACLLEMKDHAEGISSISLSLQTIVEFREKFPAWKDRDDFTIN
jgi:predicted amidohydrolase